MKASDRSLLACSLLVVTLVLFYPALFLGHLMAPQAALWGVPPWSDLGGPNPSLDEPAYRLATGMAPRLALVQRHGFSVALWNPFIGGGRVGWLAMGADGYSPLSVVAALVARDPFHWQALALVEVLLALTGVFFLARKFVSPWAAVVSAVAYTLSGPVTSVLLDVPGTTAAVLPWLLLSSLELPSLRGMAGVALASFFLWLTGSSGIFWLAVPPAVTAFRSPLRVRGGGAAMATVLLGLGLSFPSVFLSFFGAEVPGFWWLQGQPKPAVRLADLIFATEGRGDTSVYLGWPVLLLALAGLWVASGIRSVALGLAVFGAVASFLPASWLPALVAACRPTLALALGTALLAGAGSEKLLAHLPAPRRGAVASAVAALVVFRLLPAAASWFCWQPKARAILSWENPRWDALGRDPSLPLVTLLPPDSAVIAGVTDVRARSFPGEPGFARLLSPGAGGSVPFSRLTDPSLATLGVRWALEPKELSLVSGEIFANVRLEESGARGGRFPVEVPANATRIGIKAGKPPAFAQLQRDSVTWVLANDKALAGEAEGWWWWLVPEGVPPGPAFLLLDLETARHQPHLQVAWDTSGWEWAEETPTVRLWRWRQTLPLVWWHGPAESGPSPRVLSYEPGKLVIATERATQGTLGVRQKFRPAIVRATVDGKKVPVHLAAPLWTALEVPGGTHRVVLEVRLPFWVWLVPGVSAFALGFSRKVRP
ncbi:MAG: hypothetical protein ACP5NF_08185 [Thermoanaerobaculum sp.]